MRAAGLHLFFMPHFHKGADNPFSLAIGLGAINTGELLSNAMLFAGFSKLAAVQYPDTLYHYLNRRNQAHKDSHQSLALETSMNCPGFYRVK